MKRLRSKHAEDVGGVMVEPGQVFDESGADAATIERLQAEGKLDDAGRAKPATKKGDE